MNDASDYLATLEWAGRRYFARWHEGERSLDSVVRDGSGRWAFETIEDCVAAWPTWHPDVSELKDPADYDAVWSWLAGRRLALPAEDLLNVWNFTGDVARGVGIPWHDRGRLPDRIFDKLTVAAVPWIAGLERYEPRWSARELATARRMAAQAISVLKRALGTGAHR